MFTFVITVSIKFLGIAFISPGSLGRFCGFLWRCWTFPQNVQSEQKKHMCVCACEWCKNLVWDIYVCDLCVSMYFFLLFLVLLFLLYFFCCRIFRKKNSFLLSSYIYSPFPGSDRNPRKTQKKISGEETF